MKLLKQIKELYEYLKVFEVFRFILLFVVLSGMMVGIYYICIHLIGLPVELSYLIATSAYLLIILVSTLLLIKQRK